MKSKRIVSRSGLAKCCAIIVRQASKKFNNSRDMAEKIELLKIIHEFQEEETRHLRAWTVCGDAVVSIR